MTNNHDIAGTTGAASSPGLAPLAGQIFTLVGASVAGWTALSGRYRRMRKFEIDVGGLEIAFRALYQLPLVINSLIFVVLVCGAVAALFGGLLSGAVPGAQLNGADTQLGRAVERVYELGWVLVIGGVLAGVIVWFDLVARMFLFATRAVSLLPIPGVEGRFGPDGYSAGWLQAREFVRNGSDAQPLGIASRGVDRVVDDVQARLIEEGATGTDRAPTPSGSPAVRANIALFGCVIERLESELKSPRRKWDQFYGAFDDVSRSRNLFDPVVLSEINSGKAFVARLRSELDPVLEKRNEPKLTTAPVVEDDLAATFNLLKQRFHCDTTAMAHRWPAFASPAWGMYKRAGLFSALGRGAMRGQFVKLAIRWGALPMPSGPARPWGSGVTDGIGWFMLEKGAIVPLVDVKEVVFRGPINRPIAAIAMSEVIRRTAAAIDSRPPESAPKLLPDLQGYTATERRWMIEQETDTTLWRLARATRQSGDAALWKNGWRWKLDDHVARRL